MASVERWGHFEQSETSEAGKSNNLLEPLVSDALARRLLAMHPTEVIELLSRYSDRVNNKEVTRVTEFISGIRAALPPEFERLDKEGQIEWFIDRSEQLNGEQELLGVGRLKELGV